MIRNGVLESEMEYWSQEWSPGVRNRVLEPRIECWSVSYKREDPNQISSAEVRNRVLESGIEYCEKVSRTGSGVRNQVLQSRRYKV